MTPHAPKAENSHGGISERANNTQKVAEETPAWRK